MNEHLMVGQCVQQLLRHGARRATKYVSPSRTVNVTRKRYRGSIDKKATAYNFVVSIGRPNYVQAKFIKACKRAGEPFPVKKIQMAFERA